MCHYIADYAETSIPISEQRTRSIMRVLNPEEIEAMRKVCQVIFFFFYLNKHNRES